MYVWPCIIYENDERYQLDATIMIYYHKWLYMFRTSICPSSGVQVVYYCIRRSALGVVAVVLRSRCVVLCTVCEFVSYAAFKEGSQIMIQSLSHLRSTVLKVFNNELGQRWRVMTRGTNLMQQLWFIITNDSTCFGHLYAHLQECRLCTTAYGVQHWVLWLWS